MNKKIPLTVEQEKRMKDVLKLRILNEFNRRLKERTAVLIHNQKSHV
jgi:hypothetical protein